MSPAARAARPFRTNCSSRCRNTTPRSARPGRSPSSGAGDRRWQLLVRIEAPASIRMRADALDGWEATPHQRFERLLRETGVFAGLLITEKDERKDGEDSLLSGIAPDLCAARRDLRPSELSAPAARDGRRPADARRAQASARSRSLCSPMPTTGGCRRSLKRAAKRRPRFRPRWPSRCSARCTSCCAGSTAPSQRSSASWREPARASL